MIFVFGSNLAGRHGKGAAKYALLHHGAVYGKGFGLQGNSFAIPTKDANLKSLPLEVISSYIDKFIDFAKENQDLEFSLTPIGTGLAGYTKDQIRPLVFKNGDIPPNVHLTKEWFK